MSKVAVVYWSGTGNTEMMALQVEKGIKEAGGEAVTFTADQFTADDIDSFDAIAFGCPSMGSEVLEEGEFEPMFTSCEPKLKDKKIALFGSYGWGDGQWMRDWEARCIEDGAKLACEFVICNETPDADGEAACQQLGKKLV